MASKLTREEVEELLTLFVMKEDAVAVAEQIDRSAATVRNYVGRMKDGELEVDLSEGVEKFYRDTADDLDENERKETEEEGKDTPSLVGPRDEVAEKLSEFFSAMSDDTKLDYGLIDLLVIRRTRSTGEIPTEAGLIATISDATSGLDNQPVIRRIAEEYADLVEKNETIQKHLNEGSIAQSTRVGGDFQTENNQSKSAEGAGGDAIDQIIALEEKKGDLFEKLGLSDPRDSSGAEADSGNDLLGDLDTLDRILDVADRLQDDATEVEADDGDVIDRLVELEEKKVELQEALGLGGPSDDIARVESRIGGLEEALSDGSLGSAGFPDHASRPQQVAWLIENTDMDAEKASESVGENKNEAVLEWEFKRKELEQKNEMYETVSDRFATAAEQIFGGWEKGAAGALVDRFGETEGTSQQQADEASSQASGATDEITVESEPDGGAAGDEVAGEGASDLVDAGVEVRECSECGGDMVGTGEAAWCQSCQRGEAPCDECGHMLEIPSIGGAIHALCPGEGCKNVLSLPEDPHADVVCGVCDWEGTALDTHLEYVECDGCGEFRPVARDTQQQQEIKRLGLEE